MEPSTTVRPASANRFTTPLPYLTTTYFASSSDDQLPTDQATYANETVVFDKSLLRTTESTWEPVAPSLRFGLPTNMRRGRPKCCRRVRENEKAAGGKKLNCRNGSIFSRDARGRRRRKCRRRNRCKQRCKTHYKNEAWSIVGTVMKGLDFFIPKLEFKFHTGTLVLGTKFFSGLVPFIQAKIQAMHFFYSLFEPLLDGVLAALDFGRMGFRSLSLDDDDDDDDDEDDDAGVKDESDEDIEDYDDGDILPDIPLAKDDLQSLPEDEQEGDDDDEGYSSTKEIEPVDEDYGIDEDWDSDDDDDNVEEDDRDEDDEEGSDDAELEDEFQKRITLPRPHKVVKRPLTLRPTRRTALGSSNGDQQMIQEFVDRVKDGENNFTVYHSNIAGSIKNKKKPQGLSSSSTAGSAAGIAATLFGGQKTQNETQVLNVDNLVLNINSKPAEELYEDDVEYQDESVEDLDDDKLTAMVAVE